MIGGDNQKTVCQNIILQEQCETWKSRYDAIFLELQAVKRDKIELENQVDWLRLDNKLIADKLKNTEEDLWKADEHNEALLNLLEEKDST